jgi:hypothetical protein
MRILVMLISLILGVSALSSQQKVLTITLEDGQVIRVSYVGYNQDNGKIKEYQLVSGQSANLTLPGGQITKVKDVRYYHSGDLEYAKFFKPEPIKLQDGQIVKANEIRYSQNGNIDYIEFNHPIDLPNSQKVKVFRVKNDYNGDLDGYVLPDKITITLPNGQKPPATFISFYPKSSSIKHVELNSSTLIKLPDGQSVALSSITFFENGSIKSIKTLTSTDAEIKIKLPDGMDVSATEVAYYNGGVIENITFANKVKIEIAKDVVCNVKVLYYYNTAKIKEAVLGPRESVTLTVDGKSVTATNRILFDEDGNITEIE